MKTTFVLKLFVICVVSRPLGSLTKFSFRFKVLYKPVSMPCEELGRVLQRSKW